MRILGILCLCLVAGCATTTKTEELQNEWVGATRDEVLMTYGVPTRESGLSSGGAIIEYETFEEDRSWRCLTRFVLTPSNKVKTGSVEGGLSSCRAKNRL